MVSVECEPIIEICRQSPQRGPDSRPWSSGQGAKPPEAESFFGLLEVQMKCKFVHFCYPANCSNILMCLVCVKFYLNRCRFTVVIAKC